jgi:hypothetical protein
LGGDVREYYTHDTQLSMNLVFSKSTRNLAKGKGQFFMPKSWRNQVSAVEKAKGNSKSQDSSLTGFAVPFTLHPSPKSATSQLGRGILRSRMGLQPDIGLDLAPARERAGLF